MPILKVPNLSVITFAIGPFQLDFLERREDGAICNMLQESATEEITLLIEFIDKKIVEWKEKTAFALNLANRLIGASSGNSQEDRDIKTALGNKSNSIKSETESRIRELSTAVKELTELKKGAEIFDKHSTRESLDDIVEKMFGQQTGADRTPEVNLDSFAEFLKEGRCGTCPACLAEDAEEALAKGESTPEAGPFTPMFGETEDDMITRFAQTLGKNLGTSNIKILRVSDALDPNFNFEDFVKGNKGSKPNLH